MGGGQNGTEYIERCVYPPNDKTPLVLPNGVTLDPWLLVLPDYRPIAWVEAGEWTGKT